MVQRMWLLALLLVGCSGSVVTVTQPVGLPGLHALNDPQVAALATSAPPAPYVDLAVTINPKVSHGPLTSFAQAVSDERVKRLRLLCDFDGQKHVIDFYGADGKVVGVSDDKQASDTSKDEKVVDGRLGIPMLPPLPVTRHLRIEGELTVYDSRALGAFHELVGIAGDVGTVTVPGAVSDRLKQTTDKISSTPGESTRPVNLYFASPEECRHASQKCDAFLVDQSIAVVNVPSDWTIEKTANELRIENGRLYTHDTRADRLYEESSIVLTMRLHRLPVDLFSADCAKLLAKQDPVDADDLKKACSTDNLTPEDAVRFARLRDAWAQALEKVDDRETVAGRAVALGEALKACGPQPQQMPPESLLCQAASQQLQRLQTQLPHPEQLNARLLQYRKALAPLAALPTSGPESCEALKSHVAVETSALAALQNDPIDGCQLNINADTPLRCIDLKTTVEESRKARQRRDRLTDACIQQRLRACAQTATDHMRSICASLAEIDPDTAPNLLHIDADLEHPVPPDSTPQIMALLNERIDLGGKLPRTLRTERLLQLAEAQLRTMTLDAEAARIAVRMFRERTNLDGLADQAKRVETELRQKGRIPASASSVLASAGRLSRLGLADLFAAQGAAFKVKGDWEALADRIDVTSRALDSMWEELHPKPVEVPAPPPAPATVSIITGAQANPPILKTGATQ